MSRNFDIIIIGGGLVGLTAGIAAAEAGFDAVLLDARDLDAAVPDGRASTLAATSKVMMDRLGVTLKEAQPVQNMLISEGGPESVWTTALPGHDRDTPMAHVVENTHLRAALLKRAKSLEGHLTLMGSAEVGTVSHEASGVRIEIGDDTLTAKLLVAADGRDSRLAARAGIAMTTHEYDQSALVTIITHTEPHDGLALQRFFPQGPLAAIPLTRQRSQIIWSDTHSAVKAACAVPEAAFCALLSDRLGDYLGVITLDAPRLSYPLRLQTAERMTATRLALIGDAGHVIHPLAGQGLNLGLRDVAALMDGLVDARGLGRDIGVDGIMDYDQWRRVDVNGLSAVTHSLSGLFAKGGALGHIRRLGLNIINQDNRLSAALVKEAAGETGTLPSLMQAR